MLRKLLKGVSILLAISLIGLTATYMFSRQALLKNLEAASRIAQTAAGPIQYSLIGDTGPIILHIHGTPGGFNLTPFFTTKGLEGYRLLTPSRPGYVATPLIVGKTPDEQAKAYAALLDALQIDEVVVFAVSGGGPSAISFAAMYPERTWAFIGLEIASRSFSGPLEIPAFMRSDFAYWLVANMLTRFGKGLFSEEFAQRIEASPDGMDRYKEFIWSTWPLKSKLAGWQNDSEQLQHLSLSPQQITAPTLLLHGTEDQQVSYASVQELESQIPNAQLYKVEGANHTMVVSHKEELNAVINAFLEDHRHHMKE